MIMVADEMYTFTPSDGWGEIHILSSALRREILAHPELFVPEIIELPEQAMDEIFVKYGIEKQRLESMTAIEAIEAVIVGIWPDGTAIMIDGAHRRAYWAARGNHRMHAHVLPEHVWRQYVFSPDAPGIVSIGIDGSLLKQRRG